MTDTVRGRTRSRCRCGHYDSEHGPSPKLTHIRAFECRLCDCAGFHTTHYKKHISALRNAAASLRGKPLQTRLFSEDTAQEPENSGDPARPLAAQRKEHTPCPSQRHAAASLRGKPLQQRLFPISPNDQQQNSGDPADRVAAQRKEHTPCPSQRDKKR